MNRIARPLAAFALLIACQAPAYAEPAPPDPLADPAPFDASAFALRHGQLTLHQGFGLGTLGAMAATGGLGYWSASLRGPAEVRDFHLAAAGLTTGLYLTTALLALTAPSNPLVRPNGPGPWDTVSIHRNLGWLHAAGLIGTLGLGAYTVMGGDQTENHGILAATTLGLMALSAGVVAFGE